MSSLLLRFPTSVPGNGQGGRYKFPYGHYCQSQVNGNLTNNLPAIQAEINALAGAHTGIRGYVINPSWGDIEGPTQGVYPGLVAGTGIIDVIWSYLQSKVPGAYMGLMITGYQLVNLTVAQANARDFSGNTVPTYIANCGGTLNVTGPYGAGSYSLALQGNGTQYGYAIYGWNGTSYGFAIPAYFDPGVNAAFINMYIALINHVLPAAGGWPAANLNANPAIAFIGRDDEYTIDFTVGSNAGAAHGTYNPPNTNSTGNQPGSANFFAQFKVWAQQVTAAAPNTIIAGCMGYGVSSSYGTDGPTGVYSNVQNMKPVTGFFLTGADTTPSQFLTAPPNVRPSASWAQQAYLGITSPTTAPTPLASFSSNPSDLRTHQGNLVQVEPDDYLAKYSTVNQSDVAQNVLDIINVGRTMEANFYLWWMGGSSFNIGLWSTVIQPAILSGNPVISTRPSLLP